MKSKPLYLFLGVLVTAALVFIIVRQFLAKDDVETETLYCGPNNSRPVKVYKNPSKAFPVFVSEYSIKLNAGINIVDSIQQSPEIKNSLGLDLTNKVVALREQLDQESARMELIMKSNFLAFNANPCDSGITRKYYELLSIIVEKNASLEKLKAQLTLPKEKGGNKPADFTLVTDTARIRDALTRFIQDYRFAL